MPANATTHDHTAIQEWAKKQQAVPGVIEEATISNDSKQLAMLYPENKGDNKFREISWATFFDHFELRQLALRYDAEAATREYEFVTRS